MFHKRFMHSHHCVHQHLVQVVCSGVLKAFLELKSGLSPQRPAKNTLQSPVLPLALHSQTATAHPGLDLPLPLPSLPNPMEEKLKGMRPSSPDYCQGGTQHKPIMPCRSHFNSPGGHVGTKMSHTQFLPPAASFYPK